jgi:murein DD-endopeptidase MepM/ murein hydrolase activator NlpD
MTNELNFISPLKVYQTNQRIFSSQPIRHPKLDVIRPHYGDDLTAFKGQPVYAAESGVINMYSNLTGYGKTVYINHGDEYQ